MVFVYVLYPAPRNSTTVLCVLAFTMYQTTGTAFPRSYNLQKALGGSFTARLHGLLLTRFILLGPDGWEFGRLHMHGPSLARFESGAYSATLETSGGRYRMLDSCPGGGEVLTANTRRHSTGELEIYCEGQTYGARARLLRNLAIALYPGGERAIRLSGSLTGRSYNASFVDDDGGALPVAIFLLWYLAANRRRAYRMGRMVGGEKM